MKCIARICMKARTKEILRRIAQRNNVSESEVRANIEDAIRLGMNSGDPKIKEIWESIPAESGMPSVEELIFGIAYQVYTN